MLQSQPVELQQWPRCKHSPLEHSRWHNPSVQEIQWSDHGQHLPDFLEVLGNFLGQLLFCRGICGDSWKNTNQIKGDHVASRSEHSVFRFPIFLLRPRLNSHLKRLARNCADRKGNFTGPRTRNGPSWVFLRFLAGNKSCIQNMFSPCWIIALI